MELFRNTAFKFGFFASGAVFFVLNLLPHRQEPSMFGPPPLETGFPFVNNRFIVNQTSEWYFIHSGLVADGLIGIVFCTVMGLFFQYLAEQINRPKLNKFARPPRQD